MKHIKITLLMILALLFTQASCGWIGKEICEGLDEGECHYEWEIERDKEKYKDKDKDDDRSDKSEKNDRDDRTYVDVDRTNSDEMDRDDRSTVEIDRSDEDDENAHTINVDEGDILHALPVVYNECLQGESGMVIVEHDETETLYTFNGTQVDITNTNQPSFQFNNHICYTTFSYAEDENKYTIYGTCYSLPTHTPECNFKYEENNEIFSNWGDDL